MGTWRVIRQVFRLCNAVWAFLLQNTHINIRHRLSGPACPKISLTHGRSEHGVNTLSRLIKFLALQINSKYAALGSEINNSQLGKHQIAHNFLKASQFPSRA